MIYNLNTYVDHVQTLFDSCIYTGADVFMAFALEAKFVWVIRRLWLWGLDIAAEIGVKHIIKSLWADFYILMNVAAFQRIGQITKEAIGTLPPARSLPYTG